MDADLGIASQTNGRSATVMREQIRGTLGPFGAARCTNTLKKSRITDTTKLLNLNTLTDDLPAGLHTRTEGLHNLLGGNSARGKRLTRRTPKTNTTPKLPNSLTSTDQHDRKTQTSTDSLTHNTHGACYIHTGQPLFLVAFWEN